MGILAALFIFDVVVAVSVSSLLGNRARNWTRSRTALLSALPVPMLLLALSIFMFAGMMRPIALSLLALAAGAFLVGFLAAILQLRYLDKP